MSYRVTHEGLNCIFCQKLCKNLNSLTQHEIRCTLNPERKDYDRLGIYSHNTRLGQNKYTNLDIAKCANSLKKKYAEGYVSPNKGRKVSCTYVYAEHNNIEIGKWLSYLSKQDIPLPSYETTSFNNKYKIIREGQTVSGNTIKVLFEHDFLANILLRGNLLNINTVHHIDHNGLNNDIHNLMIFNTLNDHKRFHNSKYAWLIYDEHTHKFSCELRV